MKEDKAWLILPLLAYTKFSNGNKEISFGWLPPRMTAVEFIISMCEGKEHTPFESNRELAFMLSVALRMERKQIINAYENLDYDDGNEYYNATFDNKIQDQ